MPPPLIRACLAAWAERVSMMKPRSPSSLEFPFSISQLKGKKLHLAGKSQRQEFPSARTALCPPPAGDSLLSHMSNHLPFAETR